MFVALAAWILGGWSHGRTMVVVDNVVFVVLTSLATLSAALTARSMRGRLRAAWLSMTIGLLGWAIGEAIRAYYDLHPREVSSPFPADAAYLVLPVGACVAMLLFPARHNAWSRGRLFLDGVIVAGSLFLVSWVTILRPLYESGGSSGLGIAVALAYPVSDIVVLTVAAVALVRGTGNRRLSLLLLTAGLACSALSDSAFVYLAAKSEYATGNVIEIGWAAALLFITVAAVAGRESVPVDRDSLTLPGWTAVWLPYAPLLLAAIVAVAQPVPVLQTRLVMTVAGLLVVAVLGRQFLVVSENRRLLATMAEQALRDPLTALANRALFNARLDLAMQLHEQVGLPVGVVAVDLNDFKLVNDNLGHPVGDDLLIGVGRRLLNCVRRDDMVARLGGDEFAVLVQGGADDAELVGHRVVGAFNEPFMLRGHELLIRASVGLAVAVPGEAGLSAAELRRRADTAMYAAKRSRICGVQHYHSEMQWVTEVADREPFGGRPRDAEAGVTAIQRLGRLRQAIDNSALVLAYQPKFDLHAHEIVGVEALLRWPQPEGGVLTPEEFLPLVRRHGLMGAVTEFVINKALDDALSWHQAGVDVPIAVNLFAPMIANVDLPAAIGLALAGRGLNPAALTVEITEDLFLDNTESACTVLNELRSNGIRIAIDDFGSGYSALSYLRYLPIDEVKLDRDLVAPILTDPRAAAVVRAVVDLAHELGFTVVAEGVEDADTAARIRDFGCDVGQGFYYCLPLLPEGLLKLVKPTLGASPPKGDCCHM
ncbi:phosphodiesterase [Mycolicibacterium sp. CH28]|nr:phosphodiesterase [Mycolicibacterium sp. CH28]